jgi:hypothetical protein
LLILVTGCLFYPDPPAPDSAPFFEGDTAITSVDWTCSAEDDTWTFRIATEGWTGGGLLSMSDDGLRIEAHEVLTLEAAADGSTEELLLELEIEADPQLVVSGRSTRHLCNADTRAALAYRLVVYEAFENGVADCRVWGQELDWNAAAGYSVCDTRLE